METESIKQNEMKKSIQKKIIQKSLKTKLDNRNIAKIKKKIRILNKN